MMSAQKKWALFYLAAFIIMVFLNYWSTTNVGSVANNNQAIIQPAGFAFSIWGLIYILLLIWIIKIFFSKTGEEIINQVKFWPVVNFLLNGLWILVFTAEWVALSTLIIASLLFTLIKMYFAITNNDFHWFTRFPISIYFAWVTVATIVNIFTLAVTLNMETLLGMNELSWTLIAIVGVTILSVYISFKYKDWLFPLVVVWTFGGIYAENGSIFAVLDITLVLSCVVLLAVIFVEGFKKVNLRKRKTVK